MRNVHGNRSWSAKMALLTNAKHMQVFEPLGPVADFMSDHRGTDLRRHYVSVRGILVLPRRNHLIHSV